MEFLKKLYALIAIVSFCFGGILFYYDYSQTNLDYFRDYEQNIHQELQKTINSCEITLKELSITQSRKPFSFKEKKFLILIFNNDFSLTYWSDYFFIPSKEDIFKKDLQNPFLYQEKDKYFYIIPFKTPKEILLGIIPLALNYPIKNESLIPYYFTGNYSSTLFHQISQISNTKYQYGISYYGKNNEFLLSLRMQDAEPLRYFCKITTLISWSICGLAFLLFWIVYKPNPEWKSEFLFTLTIIVFRIFLIISHFPYNYVQIPLFSSQILAINEWNPSLGDLFLNFILIAFITYRWYQWFHGRNWILKWSWKWIILIHFILTIFTFILFFTFFSLFRLIIENSLVYFEFTDIFEINVYSGLLVIIQSIALLILFFLLDAIVLFSIALLHNIEIRFKYTALFVCYTIIIFSCYNLLPIKDDFFDIYHVFTLIFFIALIYHLKLQNTGHKNYFSALLIITALASIMNLALSKSFEKSTHANYEKITRTFANPRDLVMEFTFNEFVENLKSDKFIFHFTRPLPNNTEKIKIIINRLTTQYLIPNFKSYDFKVFVYDHNHNRLDNQNELQPLETEKLEKTLSPYLKFVNNKRTFYEYVYLGKFSLLSEELGVVNLEIEFYPKANFGQKLYPQLLLDESIRQKLRLPKGYEIGLYYRNILINKLGNAVFPLYLNENILQEELKNQQKYSIYYDKISDERAIIIKAPVRTFFSKLTSFTILFYIFSLIYTIINLPSLLRLVLNFNFKKLYKSLALRIQTYFLLISLLPIVIFSFLITPLFTNFFKTQIEFDLKENIKQFANHLENHLFQNTITPSENFVSYDLLNYYSDLMDLDINVFDKYGKIISTTLPRLFQTDIISNYMNPFVYHEFKNGYQSEIIQNERVGNLEYISAYVPLIDKNYIIVGYLNIPYLAKQDLLNTQIRQFLAYLINLYIVLILTTILFGLFTSSTITFPLKILSEKLQKLALGSPNEPIEWNSNDEIGELILNYNQMVKQLSESEQLLAKSEREGAWRTMARQVAHEIKNPLTPMKLSMQMLMKKIDNHNPSYDLVQKIGKTILSQIDALTHIANAFSNFAKMPEGNKEWISLNTILLELAQLYQSAEEAEVVITVPVQEIKIFAVKEQITRVLINLIKNALQAMPYYGRVEVGVEQNESQVKIFVKDNGIGIPIENQSRIFEPNFSTKTSGMGLGLAMCKNIIDAHKGTIQFYSKENEGNCFEITFPISKSKQNANTL